MSKYMHGSHSIFNLCYHIIFSSKYRSKYLVYFEPDIRQSFDESSRKLGISIKEINIMPYHIHIFISCDSKIQIDKIIKQLKGFSSYTIRHKYPYIAKYKSFWSSGYFVESIGNISEASVRKYIKNQKK